MAIGSTIIRQICLAVWDIEKAEKCWTHILGVAPERLKTPLWDNVPSYTNQKPDTFSALNFLVYKLADGLTLEIFGPGNEGPSNPWREFLEKHGEGVCNVAFFVPNRKEAYRTIGEVCKANKPYHEGFYPGGTYTFVDTFEELGVELNIKKNEDNTSLIAQLKANPICFSEI